MTPVDHIIFDLDGTLIDSSGSILDSFAFAFREYGKEQAKYSDTADMYVPDTRESVRTIRIDDMKLDDVKLMKIDVEGMEDKVIDGARSTIERNRPVLFIEIFKTDFPPIKEYLEAQRYVIFLTPSKDAICIPAEHGMGINGATRIC